MPWLSHRCIQIRDIKNYSLQNQSLELINVFKGKVLLWLECLSITPKLLWFWGHNGKDRRWQAYSTFLAKIVMSEWQPPATHGDWALRTVMADLNNRCWRLLRNFCKILLDNDSYQLHVNIIFWTYWVKSNITKFKGESVQTQILRNW